MKKKTVILIIVISLIVILFIGMLVAMGYFLIKDFKQEKNLRYELDQITNELNKEKVDIDRISFVLNRTITKDDYSIVEESCKQYLIDSFEKISQINKIVTEESINNILTIENYKKDGFEFKETKNYITTTVKQLEDYKQMLTQEKVMAYIDDKGLEDYYIDFYKEIIIKNVKTLNSYKFINKSADDLIVLLNNSKNIIDFLSNNKDNLQLDESKIIFKNEELSNQYDELLSDLTNGTTTDGNIFNKEFGSYKVPEDWVESKEHSTDSKFFYVLKGQEQAEKPNNISINVGENKYSKDEHGKFRIAILNQLSMQVAGYEGVDIKANGTTTDNGYIVYTFIIKDEIEDITTKQYYIIDDYKYVLIHETVFGQSQETDNAAIEMVNTFKWN